MTEGRISGVFAVFGGAVLSKCPQVRLARRSVPRSGLMGIAPLKTLPCPKDTGACQPNSSLFTRARLVFAGPHAQGPATYWVS